MSMPKGSATTTQSTSYPDYVEAAQRGLYDKVGRAFDPAFADPKSTIAPLNSDQLAAGNYLRRMTRDTFGGTGPKSIADAGNYNPSGPQGIGDPSRYMNPYLDRVGRSQIDEIGRSYDQARAKSGAQAANGVAFGGTGAAIREGQIARAEAQQKESAIGSILGQGWNQGTQLATADAQMRQQDNQFAAGQKLNAAIAADGADSNQFNRQQQGIQSLLQYGTMNQAMSQQERDSMFQLLSRYQSFLPGIGGTTSSSTPMYFNPLEQLLGLGLGAKSLMRPY